MGIVEKLQEDIKIAMKSKQSERLSVLRFISAQFKNKEIEMRPKTPSDLDFVSILNKLRKQGEDAIQDYGSAGRSDLVSKEQAHLDIIKEYLPSELSDDELLRIVDLVIRKENVNDMKQMGQVIKAVIAKVQGRADGRRVSEMVKQRLQAQ